MHFGGSGHADPSRTARRVTAQVDPGQQVQHVPPAALRRHLDRGLRPRRAKARRWHGDCRSSPPTSARAGCYDRPCARHVLLGLRLGEMLRGCGRRCGPRLRRRGRPRLLETRARRSRGLRRPHHPVGLLPLRGRRTRGRHLGGDLGLPRRRRRCGLSLASERRASGAASLVASRSTGGHWAGPVVATSRSTSSSAVCTASPEEWNSRS